MAALAFIAALIACAPQAAWADDLGDVVAAALPTAAECTGLEADREAGLGLGAELSEPLDQAKAANPGEATDQSAADVSLAAADVSSAVTDTSPAAASAHSIAADTSPAAAGAHSAAADADLIAAAGDLAAATDVIPLTDLELANAANAFSTEDVGITMHRLYNPNSGEHFYTADEKERDDVVEAGWNYEGVGWVAPSAGSEVYRLYNPNAGDHHYTPDVAERDHLISVGWNYEGVGWFSGGTYALLRQYNPNAIAGAHNFTCDADENANLVSLGWRAEGIGWYAIADTPDTFATIVQDALASPVARVDSDEKELHVVCNPAEGMNYLLLPSYTDLTSVRLSAVFKGVEVSIMIADFGSDDFTLVSISDAVNVATLSTVLNDDGAHLLWFKTEETSIVQKLAILTSAAISTVNIASVDSEKDRAYVEASPDHSVKADVIVTVIDKDGATVYDKDGEKGSSTIKGRGNSTWGIGDKKPYQISLNKKADLLGTSDKDNAQKKWLLLANANDVTLLHNTVAYDLALELGMVGTESVPVDLYYDGQYRGSYLLCEKIEIKGGRVDITDLEDAIEKANEGVDLDSLPTEQAVNNYGYTYQYVDGIADPKDITGGYLLELDAAYYEGEVCWFDCSWGRVVVKSPEYCSKVAMGYISEYVERAITRLADGKSAENPGNSKGALFNLDSVTNTYLISEYTKNIDAFFTSTFIYKDAGPTPLYCEPLWDFDGSMGVRNDRPYGSSFTTYQGFILPHANVATDARPIPVAHIEVVQDRARELWADVLAPLIKNVLLSASMEVVGPNGILHSLAFYRDQISASQRMDEILFGLTAFDNELVPFKTYELNYNYLFNWLGWRAAWFDDNIERIADGEINNSPWIYEGVDYGLVFDASYYIKMNEDELEPDMTDDEALAHFVNSGMEQGLVASRNFDVSVYIKLNPDLYELFGDDYEQYYLHYIEEGFEQGRIAA